eukprot:TRINITY_DN3831_c0_g1_i1.p3 TRINITY_DN3831_c0_g1~~TRINITY_DN3831_c0_g1_i1.p3  ORF type:complete len:72 (+),score=14.04 TRINITY_DN3831_c0_g1_i1:100-315(+)
MLELKKKRHLKNWNMEEQYERLQIRLNEIEAKKTVVPKRLVLDGLPTPGDVSDVPMAKGITPGKESSIEDH